MCWIWYYLLWFLRELIVILGVRVGLVFDSGGGDFGCVLLMLLQGKVKDIELKGHADSVDQLCWDPKHADLIATASGDKTVRLWDVRSK